MSQNYKSLENLLIGHSEFRIKHNVIFFLPVYIYTFFSTLSYLALQALVSPSGNVNVVLMISSLVLQ